TPPQTTTEERRVRRISALSGWRIDRRALGIAVGILGAGAVSALTLTSPNPPPIIPALLFLIPITLATAAGGRVAGWITLVGSAFGLEYLFLPPVHSWRVESVATLGTGRVSGWAVLGVFTLVGAVALELVAQQRDARRRARAAESRLALLSDASALFVHFD